jgi:hypothetical protein
MRHPINPFSRSHVFGTVIPSKDSSNADPVDVAVKKLSDYLRSNPGKQRVRSVLKHLNAPDVLQVNLEVCVATSTAKNQLEIDTDE